MLRLLIERTAGLHVMRDIGDGHHQTPSIFAALSKNCVIKITCISTINRNQGKIAQVAPADDHRLCNCFTESLGLFFYAFRPFMRQAEIPDGYFRRQARSTAFSQDFDHTTHRWLAFAGLLDDLSYNHLPRTGSGSVG